jgi:hypothetical protein
MQRWLAAVLWWRHCCFTLLLNMNCSRKQQKLEIK